MIERRILGTEVEYGIVTVDPSKLEQVSNSIFLINQFRPADEYKILWDYENENPLMDARGFEIQGEKERPAPNYNRALNKPLPNGGRMYVDGAHPEHSSPECTNPKDVVLYERAGDQILDECRKNANRQRNPDEHFQLYKNNSDGKGNSYGYHENYLIGREIPFNKIADNFIPFLITRQIYTGAGKVGCEEKGRKVPFQLSQRSDFFKVLMDLNTMVKRPIINTRDEPHSEPAKSRRLHVIVGDSNMSEYTTYLKVGTASLVLSMIENGHSFEYLKFADPVNAIKEISYDTSLHLKCKLENGKEMSAIEVQREYLEAAKRFSYSLSNPQKDYDILSKWEYCLDNLDKNPLKLSGQIDWIMKKNMIEEYLKKKDLTWDSPKVRMMDIQYHDINPDKGLYFMLEKKGMAETILTKDELAYALNNPPKDTRAFFRGECIKKYKEEVYAVSWTSVLFDVGGNSIKKVPLMDPTKGTENLTKNILAGADNAKDLLSKLTS